MNGCHQHSSNYFHGVMFRKMWTISHLPWQKLAALYILHVWHRHSLSIIGIWPIVQLKRYSKQLLKWHNIFMGEMIIAQQRHYLLSNSKRQVCLESSTTERQSVVVHYISLSYKCWYTALYTCEIIHASSRTLPFWMHTCHSLQQKFIRIIILSSPLKWKIMKIDLGYEVVWHNFYKKHASENVDG